ncbi:MAG TPA: GNAT family N-acetyltransferase [Ilumatobacter sp.]|nr:GNAT family N-acetyltransferase [Ilumatobacter sp.]
MIHDRAFAELTVAELYDILRLRSEVFVVEQECTYLDPDGRDTDAGTRHVWTGSPIDAYLRVLDDGDAHRIGRVVTRPGARSSGLAAQLVEHVLATSAGPWVLDAQSYLTGWYERLGFAVAGAEYLEDGIPHTPMRRATTA